MGEKRSEIRADIVATREDLADKLEELGMRLDYARERVKNSVNPKYYADRSPWLTFGASVAAGLALQRLVTRRRRRHAVYDGSRDTSEQIERMGSQMRRMAAQIDELQWRRELPRSADDLEDAQWRARQRLLREGYPERRETSPLHDIARAAISSITRAIAAGALGAVGGVVQQRFHPGDEDEGEADEAVRSASEAELRAAAQRLTPNDPRYTEGGYAPEQERVVTRPRQEPINPEERHVITAEEARHEHYLSADRCVKTGLVS